ncbi:MAG TPA: hypothetical protein P5048_01565 [Chlamydiales bacterium]|nr:hypothetical protein [Chlamydiales bacterium]
MTTAGTICLDLARKVYETEQKLSNAQQISYSKLGFEEKDQYNRLAKIIHRTGLTTLFSLSLAYICGSTALSLTESIAKTMMEISSEAGAKTLEQILTSSGRAKETLKNADIKTIERDISKTQELSQKINSYWSEFFQMTQQISSQEGRMYGL